MTPETRKTLETCATIAKAIEGDANLEVNFSSNGSIQIHWCGVIQVNGTPAQNQGHVHIKVNGPPEHGGLKMLAIFGLCALFYGRQCHDHTNHCYSNRPRMGLGNHACRRLGACSCTYFTT